MGFGPFGFIFRRAGAFFMRARFDDPLYKEVFRHYVAYLVREGFTQEFFIEGGRSRTGKTLAPRLGMLAWNVEAFVAQQPPRPLLRAGRDHLRAPRRGGLDDRGARGRREEAGERARPDAGAEAATPPLRQRVRELRGADLAGQRDRRAARAASRAERRRTTPSEKRRSWSGSATSSSSASTGRWSPTRRLCARRAFLGEARRGHVPRRAGRAHARGRSTCCGCRTCGSPRRCCATSRTSTTRSSSCCAADLIESAPDPRGRDPLLRGVAPARARRLPQRALPLPRCAELPGAAPPARRPPRGAARGPRLLARSLLHGVLRAEGARSSASSSTRSSTTSSASACSSGATSALAATEKGRPYFAFPRRADAGADRGLLRRVLGAPRRRTEPTARKQLEKQAAAHFERAELLGEVSAPRGRERRHRSERARPARPGAGS